MSNNGSDWLRLERFATSLLKRHADVWVVSGPLFLPELGAQPPTSTQSQPQAQRAHVSYDVIGVRQVAVPTHLYKVVLADGGEGRRLSAFVMPNAPLPGHSDLDEFVWDLAELERAAGLTFFPELPERHSIPPLCGGAIGTDTRCGLGSKLDGMIRSNKAVGQLSLASDCESLEAAWQRLGGNKEVGSGQKFHRRLHDDRAETLACPFKGRSAAGRSSGN